EYGYYLSFLYFPALFMVKVVATTRLLPAVMKLFINLRFMATNLRQNEPLTVSGISQGRAGTRKPHITTTSYPGTTTLTYSSYRYPKNDIIRPCSLPSG